MAACDGVVCLFGCMSLVPGLKQKVVSRVAFAPPSPPGYRINHGQTFLKSGIDGKDILMPLKVPSRQNRDLEISIDVILLKCNAVRDIPSFYFSNPLSKATIIYSHGNSTDLGYMFPHFMDLCQNLCVNLLAYEYTGYGGYTEYGGISNSNDENINYDSFGASKEEPSEESLYLNIQSAFDFLVKRRNVSPQNIILYGQSLGSAPSIFLAAKCPKLGGLIIHSGMKSGFTVMRAGYDKVPWFDSFRNLEHIKSNSAPALIIHGTKDIEIPLRHGIALYDAVRGDKEGWWVPNAGHNDIEVVQRSEYFRRICLFLVGLGLVERENSCLTSDNRIRWCPKDNNGSYPHSGSSSRSSSPFLIDAPATSIHQTKSDVERRHGTCFLPAIQNLGKPKNGTHCKPTVRGRINGTASEQKVFKQPLKDSPHSIFSKGTKHTNNDLNRKQNEQTSNCLRSLECRYIDD